MPPIHTGIEEGALHCVSADVSQAVAKEIGVLGFRHLPSRHPEFAMCDPTLATNVAVDLNVIWRVGKSRDGFLSLHESQIGGGIQGVAAENTVIAKVPNV